MIDIFRPPALPRSRGELSGALIKALTELPGDTELPAFRSSADPLTDDDLQLPLYLLYELHYRGFDGVDDSWEWNPDLLSLRAELERVFLAAVHAIVPEWSATPADEVGETLFELAASDEGPSLSRFVEMRASADQLRELMIHRSAYQLKEADPHTWAVPRIQGEPKSAFLEIQNDEYGGGRAERMHSLLFARSMEAVGLDGTYGAYLDRIPAISLATVNLVSLFGLHRRYRGALVGHLAMVEIGSAIPSRRYGNAMRRLGIGTSAAVDFYDEHVEADSVHENIAAYDMAQRLAVGEPELADDIIFGARALIALDGLLAERMLAAWESGESSLR
ncbi:MAG: iron-containing redox enzyme family protein [Solirubrobacterales bacterium]|nr:iron-containing redox enzyme family protein [Solirubrobacterales bacterium]